MLRRARRTCARRDMSRVIGATRSRLALPCCVDHEKIRHASVPWSCTPGAPLLRRSSLAGQPCAHPSTSPELIRVENIHQAPGPGSSAKPITLNPPPSRLPQAASAKPPPPSRLRRAASAEPRALPLKAAVPCSSTGPSAYHKCHTIESCCAPQRPSMKIDGGHLLKELLCPAATSPACPTTMKRSKLSLS